MPQMIWPIGPQVRDIYASAWFPDFAGLPQRLGRGLATMHGFAPATHPIWIAFRRERCAHKGYAPDAIVMVIDAGSVFVRYPGARILLWRLVRSHDSPLWRRRLCGSGSGRCRLMLLGRVRLHRRLDIWVNWTIVAVGVELVPAQARAHVKWFCSIADVTQPPVAINRVLTPVFLAVCCSFLLIVFAGFMLDGGVARRWPRLVSSGGLNADTEEKLVRLAAGAFFLLLWDKSAVVLWERGDAILTPELMANAWWMGALQWVIAVSVAWRRTCILGSVGICILYGYGIAQFGMFHMTDYVFFPGIAAYLALTSIGTSGSLRFRVPLLAGGLAFGLMWTAVEKFVYPEWTLFVIADHPDLAFGFPWPFVVVVAGFVEFTLAFYIMTGRGLVRFGAVAFASIFIVAIPEFGHLDAVGHIPIIAILAVVCLRGASPVQRLLGLIQRGPIANAAIVSVLYLMSLFGFFVLYYGLQWGEYG